MTIKKLASEIAKREGKKSQTQIGDIREILSILSDMINDEYEKLCNENKSIVVSLVENGMKRARKMRKKKAL